MTREEMLAVSLPFELHLVSLGGGRETPIIYRFGSTEQRNAFRRSDAERAALDRSVLVRP